MNKIILGLDKAIQAGVFSFEEVLGLGREIETLSVILTKHNNEIKAKNDAAKEIKPKIQPKTKK